MAKAENTKKVIKRKSKKAVLDKKNVKATVKKVVKSTREIKYAYPADITSPTQRKSWRQTTRSAIYKFERDIAKAKGAEKVTLNKKFQVLRKKVLLVP